MYTKEKPDENVKLSNDERWLHGIYQNAIINVITPETVLWLQKKSLYTVRVWLKYQWNLVKSSCFIKDMFSNNTYTYNAYSTFLHYLTFLFLKSLWLDLDSWHEKEEKELPSIKEYVYCIYFSISQPERVLIVCNSRDTNFPVLWASQFCKK